jgi:AmiR/NasT family two-component response regulator
VAYGAGVAKETTMVRILIAEENELTSATLQQQLTSLGYDVEGIVRSGDELTRLSGQLQPDLVLLDMQLPALTRAMLGSHFGAKSLIPAVAMTDFADAESTRQAESAGVDAYLVKPVNPEELPPAIDIALARHHELQQLQAHVDDLQETIESRKLLERAKGILMKRLHISEAEAEEGLQQRARDRKAPIKDVAQAVVDSDALLS